MRKLSTYVQTVGLNRRILRLRKVLQSLR